MLGLPFFVLRRIKERDLDLPVSSHPFTYPGLFLLGKLYDDSLKEQAIPKGLKWPETLYETVLGALLALIWRGEVVVYNYVDHRKMIFGLLRTTTSHYGLRRGVAFGGGDLLGRRLWDAVGEMEDMAPEKNSLDTLAGKLYESFFGGGRLELPSQDLMEAILEEYGKGLPWMDLDIKRRSVIRGNKLQYKLAMGKGPFLAEESAKMQAAIEAFQENSVDFSLFSRSLSVALSAESSMRLSNHHNS